MTETECHLAYAEAQANYPDPQLRALLAAIFGPDLPRLRAVVAQERGERGGRLGISGGRPRENTGCPYEEPTEAG